MHLGNAKRRHLTGSHDVVDKLIKINYDSIPKIRQDMFLDVTLVYIPKIQKSREDYGTVLDGDFCPGNAEFLLTWLSTLYGGEMDEYEIAMTLKQLAYDGLLESENSVQVHDLYKDLATREATASDRFIVGKCDKDNIRYAKVERIVWGLGNREWNHAINF